MSRCNCRYRERWAWSGISLARVQGCGRPHNLPNNFSLNSAREILWASANEGANQGEPSRRPLFGIEAFADGDGTPWPERIKRTPKSSIRGPFILQQAVHGHLHPQHGSRAGVVSGSGLSFEAVDGAVLLSPPAIVRPEILELLG